MKINRGKISTIITLGLSLICCPSVYSEVAPCFPPPTGLVAWYQAEGNALDASGNGNNGTAVLAVGYMLGEVGYGFFLTNTTTGYIQVPASTSLNVGGTTGSLTIEAWIQPFDSAFQSVCEWNANTGGGAAPIGTLMEINEFSPGDGTIDANLVDTSGISHNFYTATGVITTTNIQHVAVTYDHSTGVAILYHNGAQVASAYLGFFTPQTSYDLFIGIRPAGFFTGHQFHGTIDELSVYNTALTPCDIQSLYLVGDRGKCY